MQVISYFGRSFVGADYEELSYYITQMLISHRTISNVYYQT